MAFEEVCPERIDLIHKNYRKLCNLLIDIDEWGQVAVIHMLTRYARTQFVDPNKEVKVSFVAHTNCEVVYFFMKIIQYNVDQGNNSNNHSHEKKNDRKQQLQTHR